MRGVAIYLFLVFLSLTACAPNISDIKQENYVGKRVQVLGEIDAEMEYGAKTAYVVNDDSGSIPILPKGKYQKGDQIKTQGILTKNAVLGFYIKES